jgi:hypothetical protein
VVLEILDESEAECEKDNEEEVDEDNVHHIHSVFVVEHVEGLVRTQHDLHPSSGSLEERERERERVSEREW